MIRSYWQVADFCNALIAVSGDIHRESLLRQIASNKGGNLRLILDEKNPHSISSLCDWDSHSIRNTRTNVSRMKNMRVS